MNKINFENLPSTNTPLNANNLNQLQTNVENAINDQTEYKYIKATISSAQSISTGSVVNLDTLDGDTTNGAITLSNKGFVIGSGISLVEVSGIIFCQSVVGNAGNYVWQLIKKNNSNIVGNICIATSNFVSGVLPAVPVTVQQGDKITMVADSTASSAELRAGTAATYLMVRIIK